MHLLTEMNGDPISESKPFRYKSKPCRDKKTLAFLSTMSYTEKNLADAVVSRLDCKDERFKNVMTSLIRNLHAFVREVEPSEDEW
jgi:hypothetical protein